MDYEKRYKKALERAKDYHKQLLNEDNPELAGEIEDIFPELKESKDDRIRRTLIRYHQSTLNIDGVKGKEIVAWIEKQGKHKDYYTKQELIDMGFSFTLNGNIVTPDKMMEDMKKYLAWKEKQAPKTMWSEEDSLMIDSIIDTMKWLEGKGATNMKIDWLKSLKKRMGT